MAPTTPPPPPLTEPAIASSHLSATPCSSHDNAAIEQISSSVPTLAASRIPRRRREVRPHVDTDQCNDEEVSNKTDVCSSNRIREHRAILFISFFT